MSKPWFALTPPTPTTPPDVEHLEALLESQRFMDEAERIYNDDKELLEVVRNRMDHENDSLNDALNAQALRNLWPQTAPE